MYDILSLMRLKEAASLPLKILDYLLVGDAFREAQRNERAIVLEDTGKEYPEGVADLSFRGSMRIKAEWGKGMVKTMILGSFRLSGIDAAIKLSRRLHQKSSA